MSGIAALAKIEKRSSFRSQPGGGRFPARSSKKPVKSSNTNGATSPPVTAKMPVTIAAPLADANFTLALPDFHHRPWVKYTRQASDHRKYPPAAAAKDQLGGRPPPTSKINVPLPCH
jgi:hypothetical protein